MELLLVMRPKADPYKSGGKASIWLLAWIANHNLKKLAKNAGYRNTINFNKKYGQIHGQQGKLAYRHDHKNSLAVFTHDGVAGFGLAYHQARSTVLNCPKFNINTLKPEARNKTQAWADRQKD